MKDMARIHCGISVASLTPIGRRPALRITKILGGYRISRETTAGKASIIRSSISALLLLQKRMPDADFRKVSKGSPNDS